MNDLGGFRARHRACAKAVCSGPYDTDNTGNLRHPPVLASMDLVTAVGGVAAFCTTVSYFPQLKKSWQTGHSGDLSLRMLSILAIGIAMWTVYGALKPDIVIIIANA